MQEKWAAIKVVFDKHQIVMARLLGQSVSETARLVGWSQSELVRIYQQGSEEGQTTNRQQGVWCQRLSDA